MSLFALGVAYLIGGVTFIPLSIVAVLLLIYSVSPVEPVKDVQPPNQESDVYVYRAGWMEVRRTYEQPSEGVVNLVYRSLVEKHKKPERFYAILKQNILYLYDSIDLKELVCAVTISEVSVHLWPDTDSDGQLFAKRNAICLRSSDISLAALETHRNPSDHSFDMTPNNSLPWFLFFKVNSEKEDWLQSLTQANRLNPANTAEMTPLIAQDRALFEPEDMEQLIERLDIESDTIPMRWFNALLGRIFLGVYRTSVVEDYIVAKIVNKLKRVKIPAILSEITIRSVDVGSSSPCFSKPMLKELTVDGDASMQVHVSYKGNFRIVIDTVATIQISNRFKAYAVDLTLAVVLKQLEGNLIFKIKKPPTNRLWFAFTTMPSLNLQIEPVVSSKKIKWAMITSPIESAIRAAMADTLVMPNMDDIPFFSTENFEHRGGIWGEALRSKLSNPPSASGEVDPDSDDLEREAMATILNEGEEANTTAFEAADGHDLKQRKTETSSIATKNSADSSKKEPGKEPKKSWFSSNKTTPELPMPLVDGSATRLHELLNARAKAREKEKATAPASALIDCHPLDDTIPASLTSQSGHMSKSSVSDVSESLTAKRLDSNSSGESSRSRSGTNIDSRNNLPPPPRRNHQPAASVDSGTPGLRAPTSLNQASAMLNNWKAKASENPTIASGVASAKESMRKWGANWKAAKRDRVADDDGHVSDSRESSPVRGESYKSYRASQELWNSRNGNYFASGEEKVPTASPKLKVEKPENPDSEASQASPSSTHSTKSAKESSPVPNRKASLSQVYQASPMMAIPGIRDTNLKQAVASDHVQSTGGSASKTNSTHKLEKNREGVYQAVSGNIEEPKLVPLVPNITVTSEETSRMPPRLPPRPSDEKISKD